MASLPESAMQMVREAAAGKTCRCGHSVDHIMVGPEPQYDGWGGFWSLFVGVSTAPIKLSFVCRVCKGHLCSTKDPAILASFI